MPKSIRKQKKSTSNSKCTRHYNFPRTISLNKNWEFTATFDNYKPSKILCTFMKRVLIGPHNSDRDTVSQVKTVVEVAAQIVSQNVKSDCKTQYHQRNLDSLFNQGWKLHKNWTWAILLSRIMK